ncbi:MAG TPA: hybrid sensor histidine kinase/response regulator [Burkholderiales bacterium]|nr:hybrid sensor histidine kinase/response regulator [Burkholderiales bacterium]
MNINEALIREQAVLIHRNALTGVVGGFFIAALLVTAYWPAPAVHPQAGLWLGAGLVLAAWRLVLRSRYDPRDFSPAQATRWLRDAALGAGLSGCLWGIGSLIFFAPPEFSYHVLFIFGVAMMGTTSMFSFSAHAPTFLAFFLPTTLPTVVAMMLRGTQTHFYVGLGLLIFLVVTLRFYFAFNRMFVHSIELAFENTNLVAELTVQKEAAEAANLAKSRFLAAASHDLRQPMHALTLYLGALEAHEMPERARGDLNNVHQCAQTMDEMFRALLDISRLDAGSVQIEKRAFAVQPLLDRLAIEFAPQAQAGGLAFTVMPCEYAAFSDADAVERILRNFITNAIRYTEEGRILVDCRLQGELLRLAVHDTGLGIAPAERSKIFEEFYQVGNPERDRSKGIGLGLAIVDRLARLLDAPVTMDSTVGSGSVFALDLAVAHAAAAPAAPPPATGAGADLRGLTIVVVDDEEAILTATREVLERWGCTAITAASGSAALSALSDSPRAPDALICDYRLREHETGIDVIEALRGEFNTDIPALLVSGDSAPARMREAEANGLRVLHKPFNPEKLRAALAQVISKNALEPAE